MTFFIFRNWRLVAAGLFIFGIWLSLYLFVDHYQGVLKENARIKTEIKFQTETITTQTEALNAFREAQAEIQLELIQLKKQEVNAQAELSRLRNIFAEHDLERLANAKPDTIIRLINRGTDRTGKLLECATGSTADHCADTNTSNTGKATSD